MNCRFCDVKCDPFSRKGGVDIGHVFFDFEVNQVGASLKLSTQI